MSRNLPEATTLEGNIASLGPGHLVSDAILTEYIQSPTLVYITFWDDKSLPDCQPSPSPLLRYGRDLLNGNLYFRDAHWPKTDIRCIIENYKSAFSPLLANKYMRDLYKKLRPPPPPSKRPNLNYMAIYPKFRTGEDGAKPIDYHFLENFHRTNVRDAGLDHTIDDNSPCVYLNPSLKVWWPNIVVRMSELWDLIKDWDITAKRPSTFRKYCYEVLFGVLSCNRFMLQDYFILINRKEEHKQTRERYDTFKTDNAEYNKRLLDDMKSYDVAGKVLSDLTFASLEDFDEDQRI
ncbi:hypothetical protein F4678DRAFT_468117 [Xylaria arbuscula]|nr:hypothetical protein F4678DRAFT_468117 [Xylaria arbuscula]